MASDERTCTKCSPGFLLLDGTVHLGGGDYAGLKGACVPHPIPNCEKFSETSVALGTAFAYNSVTTGYFADFCTKCMPGHFRNGFG